MIGASTGYGLSSRITAAFGSGAATLGIFFERPVRGRPPRHAGLVQLHRLHPGRPRRRPLRRQPQRRRLLRRDQAAGDRPSSPATWARSTSSSTRSPRRAAPIRRPASCTSPPSSRSARPTPTRPSTPTRASSATSPSSPPTKPRSPTRSPSWAARIGKCGCRRSLDAKLLAPGATAVAYSYIGPDLTWPIYKDGTIGRAKIDLERAAERIDATAQGPRRRPRLHLGQQGARHPGQLGHPRRAALHFHELVGLEALSLGSLLVAGHSGQNSFTGGLAAAGHFGCGSPIADGAARGLRGPPRFGRLFRLPAHAGGTFLSFLTRFSCHCSRVEFTPSFKTLGCSREK